MVKLNDEHIQKLEEHLISNIPEIICGAIIGSSNGEALIIDLVERLDNERYENRTNRYLISPDQYKLAEKIAFENNLELLGFYHSSKLIQPSEYDLNFALPGLLYLIISINNNNLISSAWKLNKNKKKFDEHKIEIIKTNEMILSPKLAIAV